MKRASRFQPGPLLTGAFLLLLGPILLLPPGFCLCHGPESLGFAQEATDSHPEDEEHAPGCPGTKKTYLQQAPESHSSPIFCDMVSADRVVDVPAYSGCLEEHSGPFLRPADTPIYLIVRAFLI